MHISLGSAYTQFLCKIKMGPYFSNCDISGLNYQVNRIFPLYMKHMFFFCCKKHHNHLYHHYIIILLCILLLFIFIELCHSCCCDVIIVGQIEITSVSRKNFSCTKSARGYVFYEFDSPSGDVCNLAYIGAKNLIF